jgi:hypothetical protein
MTRIKWLEEHYSTLLISFVAGLMVLVVICDILLAVPWPWQASDVPEDAPETQVVVQKPAPSEHGPGSGDGPAPLCKRLPRGLLVCDVASPRPSEGAGDTIFEVRKNP